MEVLSESDVKVGIGTAKDIDVMHAPNLGGIELSSNRGKKELPLDCSLRSRSRHHSTRGNWVARRLLMACNVFDADPSTMLWVQGESKPKTRTGLSTTPCGRARGTIRLAEKIGSP